MRSMLGALSGLSQVTTPRTSMGSRPGGRALAVRLGEAQELEAAALRQAVELPLRLAVLPDDGGGAADRLGLARQDERDLELLAEVGQRLVEGHEDAQHADVAQEGAA